MKGTLIPVELRERPQWVLWKLESRDGRPTKVPYRADGRGRASSTDPATWADFDTAAGAASPTSAGLGFVFSASDPFFGVDLDHCVADGDIDPLADAIVGDLNSYTEISPSGTGLHIIAKGSLKGNRRRTGATPWGGQFESYDQGRFFCMTGRHVAETPLQITEAQERLDAVRARLFPPEPKRPARIVQPAIGDDRELLDRAGAARNGSSFQTLYSGRHDYSSASEADLALCNLLAFWSGPDQARIDRLFRGSGLMREKWDHRRGETTYGEQTIERALAGRTEFYSEPTSSNGRVHLEDAQTPDDPPDAPRFIHARDLLASLPPEPEGVLGKYIVPGCVTILAKAPKTGGSTLALAMTEAVASNAERFLGQAINGGPVLYVSEENAGSLAHKMPAGDVHFLTRDLAWPPPSWDELIELTAVEARRVAAVVVVIDTLAHWSGLEAEKEKDAGAMQAKMRPVQGLARDGLAVLLPVHSRKGGGEHGDGIRGSSALAGAADIILEIERVNGSPRQRALLALSRFPSTPGALVLEFSSVDGSWAVIGEGAERGDSRSISDRQAILEALRGGELTRAELEAAVGTPERQWHGILDTLVHERLIERTGAGRKGDPYRFSMLRTDAAQQPAQKRAETENTAAVFSAALSVGEQQKEASVATNPNPAPRAESSTRSELTKDELQQRVRKLGAMSDEDAEAEWQRLEAAS